MAKRKKKTSKKVARKTGGRRGGGAGLSAAPVSALMAEVHKRAAALEARRDSLRAQLEEVERALESLAGLNGVGRAGAGRGKTAKRAVRRGGGGGRRPRNKQTLEEALAQLLKGRTMSVTEMTRAVQEAGYKTTSPNFRVIVNQTLLRSPKFRKVARGKYTAK